MAMYCTSSRFVVLSVLTQTHDPVRWEIPQLCHPADGLHFSCLQYRNDAKQEINVRLKLTKVRKLEYLTIISVLIALNGTTLAFQIN